MIKGAETDKTPFQNNKSELVCLSMYTCLHEKSPGGMFRALYENYYGELVGTMMSLLFLFYDDLNVTAF